MVLHADAKLAMSGNGRHCLDRIQDKVEDHLFASEPGLRGPVRYRLELDEQHNFVSLNLGSRERDDVKDDLIDIKRFPAWRDLLASARTRTTISLVLFPSSTMLSRACLASSRSGGCATSHCIAASALATTPAIGWLTS